MSIPRHFRTMLMLPLCGTLSLAASCTPAATPRPTHRPAASPTAAAPQTPPPATPASATSTCGADAVHAAADGDDDGDGVDPALQRFSRPAAWCRCAQLGAAVPQRQAVRHRAHAPAATPAVTFTVGRGLPPAWPAEHNLVTGTDGRWLVYIPDTGRPCVWARSGAPAPISALRASRRIALPDPHRDGGRSVRVHLRLDVETPGVTAEAWTGMPPGGVQFDVRYVFDLPHASHLDARPAPWQQRVHTETLPVATARDIAPGGLPVETALFSQGQAADAGPAPAAGDAVLAAYLQHTSPRMRVLSVEVRQRTVQAADAADAGPHAGLGLPATPQH